MSDADSYSGFIPMHMLDMQARDNAEIRDMFMLPRDFEFPFNGREIFSRIWYADGMMEIVSKSPTFASFGRGDSIREALDDWQDRAEALRMRYITQGEKPPL